MAFKALFEDPAAEVARLAAAPEGSRSHALSKLPVRISGWIQDFTIELPWAWAGTGLHGDHHRVVVVPIEYTGDGMADEALPRRRHSGFWTCAVIASNDERYPVGGHRLVISEAELVRGRQLSL